MLGVSWSLGLTREWIPGEIGEDLRLIFLNIMVAGFNYFESCGLYIFIQPFRDDCRKVGIGRTPYDQHRYL